MVRRLLLPASSRDSRSQPGMRIITDFSPEKDTGGERRWLKAPLKQGSFSHSGSINSGYFSPFYTFRTRIFLFGMGGLPLYYLGSGIFLRLKTDVAHCGYSWQFCAFLPV